MADALQGGKEVWAGIEAKGPLPVLSGIEDLCMKLIVTEDEALSHLNFFAGLHQSAPKISTEGLRQKNLDLSRRCRRVLLGPKPGPAGEEARRNYAGVIEHKKVTLPEQIGKVEEVFIFQMARRAVEREHPCRIPLGRRLLGDQFRGKVEVKVGDAHSFSLGSAGV